MNLKVQEQVASLGLQSQQISAPVGPLFTEPILVVNQKPKLFEAKAEYSIFDQYGLQIGAVRQVGENLMRKALAVTPERNRARKLEILDHGDRVVFRLVRPAKSVKSSFSVSAGDGSRIGEIVQENTPMLGGIVRGAVGLMDRFSPVNLERKIGQLGYVRFSLMANDEILGSIQLEDTEEWDFRIQDADGVEIARITRTWAGFAKEMFTKADNYVVQIHRPLEGSLRSLVIAAAVAVDTVFRQDSN
ncbi:phospholipid scramblase-related protein [Propionimicrobium sp. PCR01-08-3]|uniref:phospholipid scramblase-related protein n=1 Tax=Propionimicrobium sp. PCR01-08-3 TaxID=3052086 RepID=UPI00255C4CD3|nr:phospholipid scramblase-related protein [Propionimicrobium sp. PCR01-08-3]WIY83556.1 phospholipid scramblase-related protein [Propionimicrobium sp. PCR01-08-3]